MDRSKSAALPAKPAQLPGKFAAMICDILVPVDAFRDAAWRLRPSPAASGRAKELVETERGQPAGSKRNIAAAKAPNQTSRDKLT